jgi:hypothetical protein
MSPVVPPVTIGRIVLYQRHGSPNGQHASEPSPAVVTKVYAADGLPGDPLVGLCVLNPTGIYFNESVTYDPEGAPGTWRWPPRI